MELKEFIKTALSDITGAVSELQAELKNGAVINPTLPYPVSMRTVKALDDSEGNRVVSDISFDIAVTIADSKGANAGLSVFSIGIGGKMNSKEQNVSRISFSIPVALPSTRMPSNKEISQANLQKPVRKNPNWV